ncbi:GTP cyclohydrolase FolE2 [Oceanimonas baumannii]|uniref:GTP cyclohydrolase FolE2 n=1 Tax=Oceanimonas baumannii TaxID=129578 RepID=A0A235CBR4_9GAMM|nr:GTP cyclohydrolase FolE2 [Oceanimonas baumannii]OYD21437.1 GTP cyclohydrolase I FolE2 [Oceanimonas baumannii]TDW56341.1 GTP cyclohydrolase I [Oceanimonas baumannii]
MNRDLPDVAATETPSIQAPLQWVGMSRIDIPFHLAEPGCPGPVHAMADVQVNLPAATIKGIHMSRIYRMLDDLSRQTAITPSHLETLLGQMVESHRDCETDSARVILNFNLLVRRPALKTPELAGWKSYPARLEATLARGHFSLEARVQVEYSSTCPCSAALSRQLVARGFREHFPGDKAVTTDEVTAWLKQHATLATPHSQRSEAQVTVTLASNAPDFGLMPLIDQIEEVLTTPVQTAVKRADEQAFAWLNGQNLMYVEDAARRIQHALLKPYATALVHVRHLESLHSHDAVASANGNVSSARFYTEEPDSRHNPIPQNSD